MTRLMESIPWLGVIDWVRVRLDHKVLIEVRVGPSDVPPVETRSHMFMERQIV